MRGAILTGVIIADVNVLAREFESSLFDWTYITLQLHDTGKLEGGGRSSCRRCVVLENLNLTLKVKDESFLPVNQFDRLVARIKYECLNGVLA